MTKVQTIPSRLDKFTEDDTARLVELYNSGATFRDIALTMGRPFLNIRNKVHALQRKGVLAKRTHTHNLPENYIEHTAGANGLPISVVEWFAKQFSGPQGKRIAGIQGCCIAWERQNGKCYYLKDKISLVAEDTPNGAVPMYGANGEIILVCKAISHTRNTMSHGAFVKLCHWVSQNFDTSAV